MGIYLKDLDFYPVQVCREGAMFAARFVDIPNCLAYGASAVEAEAKAAEALTAYLTFLAKHGMALPSPSVVSAESNNRDRYVAYVRSSGASAAPATTS